jgi:hypothetical protein
VRGGLAACALAGILLVGGPAAGSRPPAYATISKGTTSALVRVDPATLRISGPRLSLWRHDLPWTRSPDGSQLAFGSGRVRSIRLVDLRDWYVVRDLPLPNQLVALAWPRADRLVAVVAGRCCPQALRALALNPASGRITASSRVGSGAVLDGARTPVGLALLLAPQTRIGFARLVTVDWAALVRSVGLGIEAGWTTVGSASSGPPLSRFRTPGLAVDPAGHRALVAGGSTLAAVDLRTLRVRAAPLRFRTLADGGVSSGTFRRAVWLAGDVVAVTGWTNRAAQRSQTTLPAGLLHVNASTLAVRRLDARTSTVTRARGLLLASGARGLTVYDLDGRRRYQVLGNQWLGDVRVAGSYAYAGARDSYKSHPVQVLDLRSGGRVREVWVRGLLAPLSDVTPTVCWC